MKVIWLNDSLVVRAESKREKDALAAVYSGIVPEKIEDIGNEEAESTVIDPSVASSRS